jgi:hypothetical protein
MIRKPFLLVLFLAFFSLYSASAQCSPGPSTGTIENRCYEDGYVYIDISGNAGGQTWYWGYQSSAQIVGNYITFRSRRPLSPTSEEVLIDSYEAPDGVFVIPNGPYAGTFSGPGPLLHSAPTSRTILTSQPKKVSTGRVLLSDYSGRPVKIAHTKGIQQSFALIDIFETDAEGYFYIPHLSKDSYIFPISSGSVDQSFINPNEGRHGLVFSPGFFYVQSDLPQSQVIFAGSTKPTPIDSNIVRFKLPFADTWQLTVEAGGYAATSKNAIDGDPAHTDGTVTRPNTFYALDFAPLHSRQILASASGAIMDMSYHKSWGNNILINHHNGYYTRYAHLKNFAPGLTNGVSVWAGRLLGDVGNGGTSSGVHLHWGIYYGGATSTRAASTVGELRNVRVETRVGDVPLIEFLAGQQYHSTNVASP